MPQSQCLWGFITIFQVRIPDVDLMESFVDSIDILHTLDKKVVDFYHLDESGSKIDSNI